MCLCESIKVPRGGIAPFWGSANLPEKLPRDMGYRSDSIAISRDMGPISLWTKYFFEYFWAFWSEPPIWGRQKGVTPIFPICSDFPVFFQFVPICAPCFREYPDLFWFVPICPVLFRFVPICFQNKSEQIRENPVLPTPNANPRFGGRLQGEGVHPVRYLCKAWESLHMFFTKMCPSGVPSMFLLKYFLQREEGAKKLPSEETFSPETSFPFSSTCPLFPCNAGFAKLRKRKFWWFIRGPKTHPKSWNTKKNTAFTRTFSKSSRELFPSSLWHESGTQRKLLRKTCSDELFSFGWISWGGSTSSNLCLSPARENFPDIWGWGFAATFAQIWHRFFCSFSGFHLPENGMFKPVLAQIFGTQIFAQIFGTHFCADVWCADFYADFCTDFWRPFLCRCLVCRFSKDFSSTFWRFKNRCSRATQKCTDNLRKNLRRPNGPARGGTPFHLCFLEQTARRAIAARPLYSRRAYERPRWHLWAERHAWICSKIFPK